MKHEIAINRSLRRRDPTQFPRDPSGAPDPLILMERMDASVSAIWVKMAAWSPEQRRENLPDLLNAIRRLETRLMVLRQGVARDISGAFELVKPRSAGIVPDTECEAEGA
jgi:hypothetical protein